MTTKQRGKPQNPAMKNQSAYQIKVTLDGIQPAIWRRLVVPSDITLDKLHEVLQIAMGWTNSHLHQFNVGKTYYGIPDDEFDDMAETQDEREATLAQLATRKGANILYEYDMGDGWMHVILVEDILAASAKKTNPRCLDGARACPPEDVGSYPGYEDFLAAIKNPKHPEHKELLEWAGGSFDPEAFDVSYVNEGLEELRKAGSLEALWLGEAE